MLSPVRLLQRPRCSTSSTRPPPDETGRAATSSITPRQLGLVRLIGALSTGLGAALVSQPRRASSLLALPHHRRWTRLAGTADVALGVALVRGRRPRRWMHVRASANLGVAILYAAQRSSSTRPARAGVGCAAMALLALTDGVLARQLPGRGALSSLPAHEEAHGSATRVQP